MFACLGKRHLPTFSLEFELAQVISLCTEHMDTLGSNIQHRDLAIINGSDISAVSQ